MAGTSGTTSSRSSWAKGSDVRARVSDVRDQVKEKAGDAADTARDLYGRARVRTQEAAGLVDTVVSDRPYAAMAAAAVAGLALGLLLGLVIADQD
ncbi:MAG: hypothetical protein ABI376_04915 [Caulobacteraceae bacterium]